MELAKTLKGLRLTYGDNLYDFSDKLGIYVYQLINIEHDIDSPSEHILKAYSNVLSIKVSTILLIAETKEEVKHEPFYKRWLQPLMKKVALRYGR